MYLIVDNYGTRQTAWTRRNALQWLAACGTRAVVIHRLSGRVVARRKQHRVY